MLLRKAASEGAAMTFIAVTTVFTAVVLLGWRVILNRAAHRGP